MTNGPGELVVTNLTKCYDAPTGQVTVLGGVSFSARPGETVAIDTNPLGRMVTGCYPQAHAGTEPQ